MRKTRSDAVLLNLPEEQQAQLAEWLLSGMPYHEAKVLAEKEFGISVKSLASFGSFWSAVCQPALLARRRRAAGSAEERAAEMRRNPAAFSAATLDAIEERAFEMSQSPQTPAKDVKAMMTLLLKAYDQRLTDRKVTLLEAAAAKADAAEKVTRSDMTAEEKAARMKQIFGMG